jgi:renalase
VDAPLTSVAGSAARVLVVGAGVAGVACAAALRAAGVDVVVREQAEAAGGRLGTVELHGRPVDLGAAYFTVADDEFAAPVSDWHDRGLVRPWTDTIDVAGAEPTTGPLRWSAPGGLRSLVDDLLEGLVDVTQFGTRVEAPDPSFDVTVLAMPDPQAARVVGDAALEWTGYEPAIVVAAGWEARGWSVADAAFVNDDPDLTLVVDDGARRGDGVPVLVAHTTPELARRHLDDPERAVPEVLAALARVFGVTTPPRWTYATVWREAKPAGTHGDQPFALTSGLALCGDTWCPSGSPRVEAAWLSGHRLGRELARRST